MILEDAQFTLHMLPSLASDRMTRARSVLNWRIQWCMYVLMGNVFANGLSILSGVMVVHEFAVDPYRV